MDGFVLVALEHRAMAGTGSRAKSNCADICGEALKRVF
jgi:hypothetical protein